LQTLESKVREQAKSETWNLHLAVAKEEDFETQAARA
jgi:hypothetical protein